MKRRDLLATGLLAAPPLLSRDARAAVGWPVPRLAMIVSAAAGGSIDALIRPLAEGLQGVLGRPVVVDNRGGSGGMLAADYVAKAQPDGGIFLCGGIPHAIIPAIYPRVPYDTERDLTPVTRFAQIAHVIIASPKQPARNLQDFVAWAKAKGGANYGTGGAGTVHHLGAEQFAAEAGIPLTAVHYRGSGPAVTDLMAGSIDVMFETMPSALSQIRAGNVIPLAVCAARRSPALPEVPTVAEAGFAPLELTTWYGLFGPKNLPGDLATGLCDAVREAFLSERLRATYAGLGAEVVTETPAAFTAFFGAEIGRWGLIARRVGARAE